MTDKITINEYIEVSDCEYEDVELFATVSLDQRGFDEFDNEMEYDVLGIGFEESGFTKTEIVAIYTYIEENREDLNSKFIEQFIKENE